MTSITELIKLDYPAHLKVGMCRVVLGVSQTELAEMAGLTQVQVSMFEKGRTKRITMRHYGSMMKALMRYERIRNRKVEQEVSIRNFKLQMNPNGKVE
jgi:DNA-binding Xre family transcriptional regulator